MQCKPFHSIIEDADSWTMGCGPTGIVQLSMGVTKRIGNKRRSPNVQKPRLIETQIQIKSEALLAALAHVVSQGFTAALCRTPHHACSVLLTLLATQPTCLKRLGSDLRLLSTMNCNVFTIHKNFSALVKAKPFNYEKQRLFIFSTLTCKFFKLEHLWIILYYIRMIDFTNCLSFIKSELLTWVLLKDKFWLEIRIEFPTICEMT